MKTNPLVGLHCITACREWLKMRHGKLVDNTIHGYGLYIDHLAATLQEICKERGYDYNKLLIDNIDGDWLRWFQDKRQAGPGIINKECGIVRMTYFQAFQKKITDYQRLQMPKDYEGPGRKLAPEEGVNFEQACIDYADHPWYAVAALCSLLSKSSGMGPGEIKSLKLKNVFLDQEGVPNHVYIDRRGAKRIRRERNVQVYARGEWALRKLVKRARDVCGCTSEEHFLVPHWDKHKHVFDPTRPCCDWRRGLDIMFNEIGSRFRPYDLRHHAVSVTLGDKRTTLPAAIKHFGWISPKMIARYYHADFEELAPTAQACAGVPPPKPQPVPIKKPVESEPSMEQFAKMVAKAMKAQG